MNFLSQWRIGRRLSVAFAVVVALTIASATFSQLRLMEIQARAHELTAEQAERTALAYRWRQNVSVNANRAAMVAVMTDATLAQPLLEKIKATSADSASLQKRFETIETTAKGKQIQQTIAEARAAAPSRRPSPRARRRPRSMRSPRTTWASSTRWSRTSPNAPRRAARPSLRP
ncbi:MAG: MCP four helix bundle domain-containing protein [Burkholderiales bacterium]|nr:MCP four helix bundle domain-containing protein [Burkholderiales bacterium]